MKENKVFIAIVISVAVVMLSSIAIYNYEPSLNENEEKVMIIIENLKKIEDMNITSYECKETAPSLGRLLNSVDYMDEMDDVRPSISKQAVKMSVGLKKRYSNFTLDEIAEHHAAELKSRLTDINLTHGGKIIGKIENGGLVYKLNLTIKEAKRSDHIEILKVIAGDEAKVNIALAVAAGLTYFKLTDSNGEEIFQSFEGLNTKAYRREYVETLKASDIWMK